MSVTGLTTAFALLSFTGGDLSASRQWTGAVCQPSLTLQAARYGPEDVPGSGMQRIAAMQTGEVCHRPLLLGLPNCDNPHRNMHVNGGSRPRSSGDPCDN
ncbi:MAG: hypothetical protein ABW026_11985 [Microvirga sp.]